MSRYLVEMSLWIDSDTDDVKDIVEQFDGMVKDPEFFAVVSISKEIGNDTYDNPVTVDTGTAEIVMGGNDLL